MTLQLICNLWLALTDLGTELDSVIQVVGLVMSQVCQVDEIPF